MPASPAKKGSPPTSLLARLVPAFVLAAVIGLAFPDDTTAAESERGTLNFVLENDLFSGRDRDYTNGVLLSWITGPADTPDWALAAARMLPFFPDHGTARTSYAVGQNMYTPSNIQLSNPPTSDRPYAGWLYGAIGLTAETGTRLDQLQLQLGVIGPASYAEETQKFVHGIIGANQPRGWSYQLRNEPGLELTYQRSWRQFVTATASGIGFDATPHVGAALGNVFIYANTGATLRLGWNLPNDYGPPRIQPSLPGSGFFEPTERIGAYIFAGLDGRAVARNIFLDGNTFQESRHVDKIPWVADAQVGLAITFERVRIAYTHVFRTREFEGQNGADKFGAVSISVRF